MVKERQIGLIRQIRPIGTITSDNPIRLIRPIGRAPAFDYV